MKVLHVHTDSLKPSLSPGSILWRAWRQVGDDIVMLKNVSHAVYPGLGGSKFEASAILLEAPSHLSQLNSTTIMSTTTQPLVREQQLFLQRILASHCISHNEARALFTELRVPNDSLEEAFEDINFQLTKGFGLEIATVVLDKTKYHSIINLRNDEVAADAFEHRYNPHEKAYIRLMLGKFAQEEESSNEDGTNATSTSIPKKDLINCRTELEEPYKISSVAQAEYVVETLIDEQYLRIVSGGRRESLQAHLELAPRAYLELSMHLTELGIPQEKMPQFLFHRR